MGNIMPSLYVAAGALSCFSMEVNRAYQSDRRRTGTLGKTVVIDIRQLRLRDKYRDCRFVLASLLWMQGLSGASFRAQGTKKFHNYGQNPPRTGFGRHSAYFFFSQQS
jgi:hypothetical protein